MAACDTIMHMGHERKVENLRDFMANFANSRGMLLPETKLFEQKFLDLCLSRIPDHPTYSAMIFIAFTDLSEEGGSSEESISEFIKSKYKNLPFAHTSLLSHHLAKLVEKREILCDYTNYCYTLPGEDKKEKEKRKKNTTSSDVERKSNVITVRTNEVMTRRNKDESIRNLDSSGQKVDLLGERSLVRSETSPKRKACCDIDLIELSNTEGDGGEASLRDSTVETLRIEGVAKELEVAVGNTEVDCRLAASSEGGELYDVVVLDAQSDPLMKESCVEVKSGSSKRLLECQTEACNNIIALEKMLKQCREKDQQNINSVPETDDVTHLPLSMENCVELRKFTQMIERQLSEIIGFPDESVVPYNESRGCEDPRMKTPCGNKESKELEHKEREIASQKKPQAKKTRNKRLRDMESLVLRKSPRAHKRT